MRFCVLGSGSKGNSIWVQSDQGAVLVDAGLSWKTTKSRLAEAGLDPFDLKAIVISHEHSDHLKGASAVARAANVPVYATDGTLSAWCSFLGDRASKFNMRAIAPGSTNTVAGIRIHTFSTSHDVSQPVMFVMEAPSTANGCARLGLATDLGTPTRLVQEELSGCNALVLEFNHDPDMLVNGPYPWHLKQRIRSRLGHLSNAQAAELLYKLDHSGLDTVVLAHLSEVNNTPQLALEAARTVFHDPGNLHAAGQYGPTKVFEL